MRKQPDVVKAITPKEAVQKIETLVDSGLELQATETLRQIRELLEAAREDSIKHDAAMNYAEAAAHIDTTEATLKFWISTGTYAIPYVRVGKRGIRFLRSDLDAWMESRKEHRRYRPTGEKTKIKRIKKAA